MVIIREFETMLNLIKTTNEYKGIAYNHPGPAHLSIGQEAAAVGMAYNLNIDDYHFWLAQESRRDPCKRTFCNKQSR